MTDSSAVSPERLVVSGSPHFADLIENSRITSRQEIDKVLNRLRANKDSWAHLGIHERLSLLDEVRRDFISIGDRWVAAELEAKKITPQTLGEAEEWTILATIHRSLRTLRRSLAEIEAIGQPRIPGPVAPRPNGQVVAQAFPLTHWDRFLFLGVTGEVWMEPGVSVEETSRAQAAAYKDTQRRGKVSLVLGAGNASVLPISDASNTVHACSEIHSSMRLGGSWMELLRGTRTIQEPTAAKPNSYKRIQMRAGLGPQKWIAFLGR